MEWNDNLPDVSVWQPRSDQSATLSTGLLVTCQAVQSRIIMEAEIERTFNIDNYDSGPGLEDLVRQEISKLLPRRYLVDAGVVNDRDGRTAGDYDIVVRDRIWAPATKLGATPESRRYHFPVESIYSAIEVKQTLGFQQLDDAMGKLVKLSRLNRPHNPYGHITENQHLRLFDKDGYILNPMRTIVFAAGLQKSASFSDVARRFGQINASLTRNDMVTDLYVLAHGGAHYSIRVADTIYSEATFMSDRHQPLVLSISEQEPGSVFYMFFVHLLGHLTRSVLRIHDVSAAYGRLPQAEHLIWDTASYNSGTI